MASTSHSQDPIVAGTPFFYGWVMLPIGIVGHIATSPGQSHGISVFNESFRHDLGLSHTELTGAYLLGTLLAALPVSFVGVAMDRYGIRRAMTVVVLLFGVACIATSQVIGPLTLILAFFMLRTLGQGALTLLSDNTVAMWFHARLGTVSGLMSVGTAVAFAVIPPANLYLIHHFGWRWAYVLLGIAVWLVMLPLLAIFFRNRPEDVGQVPDGRSEFAAVENRNTVADFLRNMTLRQAIHTRAYWILLLIHSMWGLVGTAIVFNIVPLFSERGLSSEYAAMYFMYFALSMAVSQFVGGLLADRFPLNLLLAASMVGSTLSLAQLIYVEGPWSAAMFTIVHGASQGLYNVLGKTVWARYFGREHLGKIRGIIRTAGVAGSSIGPFTMGVTKDLCGVYTPSIWLFLTTYAFLSVAALFATFPRRVSYT